MYNIVQIFEKLIVDKNKLKILDLYYRENKKEDEFIILNSETVPFYSSLANISTIIQRKFLEPIDDNFIKDLQNGVIGTFNNIYRKYINVYIEVADSAVASQKVDIIREYLNTVYMFCKKFDVDMDSFMTKRSLGAESHEFFFNLETSNLTDIEKTKILYRLKQIEEADNYTPSQQIKKSTELENLFKKYNLI